MKVQGIDFKWARMHIDSILISDVANIGTKDECWDYVFIHFKYLKEGCELSYDRASNLIPKDTLDNLIHKYYMIEMDGDLIRIPMADENWEQFMKQRKLSSKGGKKTQAKKKKKEQKVNDERELERIEMMKKDYGLEDVDGSTLMNEQSSVL
jgi:hypothetical protein